MLPLDWRSHRSFFYGCWDPSAAILLACSIAFNYCSGVLIHRFEEKPVWQKSVLGFAIAGNVALLAYYKYWFPLVGWLVVQI